MFVQEFFHLSEIRGCLIAFLWSLMYGLWLLDLELAVNRIHLSNKEMMPLLASGFCLVAGSSFVVITN